MTELRNPPFLHSWVPEKWEEHFHLARLSACCHFRRWNAAWLHFPQLTKKNWARVNLLAMQSTPGKTMPGGEKKQDLRLAMAVVCLIS